MNILLLAPQPFYQERGTPIAVRLLARTLGELGHTVHLLVYAEGEEVAIPGVTIHRTVSVPGMSGIRPGFSLKKLVCDFFLFVKCLRLVRKYDFQLVHAVEESVFMAMVVRKLTGIPYVYDMDSCMSEQLLDRFTSLKFAGRLMQRLEKAAIVHSAGVIAVCRSLEDIARKASPGTLTTRLEDVSLLKREVAGKEDLRQVLGIRGTLLLYVGNLEKYQGVDLLLAGFKEAVARKNDLSLVIIGGGRKERERYAQRTKELGIASNVFFCGPRPVTMLGYYLGQADMLVSPRTQGNNTPMKIYSYLDSGIPVIATRLPTHTQVLDEAIACLVDPEPETMADGIIALAENKEQRRQIGEQARRRAEAEYSMPAFKRKLAAFYEQLQL